MHFPTFTAALLLSLVSSITATPLPEALPQGQVSPGAPLRILPIGDSITEGFTSPDGNGYRRRLAWHLRTMTHTVFVGTLNSGTMPNNAHDGFGGKKIAEITQLVQPALNSVKADIILIHAGTNDITSTASQQQLDAAPGQLSTLIQNCITAQPNAAILVAQIIPKNPGTTDLPRVQAFNAQIPGVVAPFKNQGKKVMVVNFNGIQTPGDLIDGVHPNQNGYWKMGMIWFQAIKAAGKQGLIARSKPANW